MTNEEILKRCIEEEEKYQFTTCTQTDAFQLGKMLYETSMEEFGKPIAVEIRINHLTVFRFLPEGTGANQCIWLKAKAEYGGYHADQYVPFLGRHCLWRQRAERAQAG